ncbi:peptidyl-prolyl cis-trans isomerase A-like [Corythoichthys intestinalis]|uniref:peptidyl-prolyl cis-trans isomerase A-like n=1 Tax=Corythoichthys intestinalis TaxID=161448 RepID=UPI0025A59433|nr:peptidyl-prolyl cis-trans isomerase A-like [Corythoichthys intestinalis]XP_061799308.1 peptidyl-prolyl cis-trans isomerase A-like [Nerophis lumbriciformis]
MSLPVVFVGITIGGVNAGRITVDLQADSVTKTAKNFRAPYTGEKGFYFNISTFHCIIPKLMPRQRLHQWTGGRSVYSKTFNDESFQLKHKGIGKLSIASAGSITNGSQFLLCTDKTDWFNGKHVVFGKGLKRTAVLKSMVKQGSSSGENQSQSGHF